MMPANRQIRPLELVIWAIASSLLSLAYMIYAGGVALYNDSFQYISLSENILSGNGLQTSIIHFDIERRHGTVPAPLTTFPPGYGLLLAAVAFFGASHVSAGLLIGIGSLASLVLLISAMARLFNLSLAATRVLLLFFIGNSLVVSYTITLMSEPVFTAVSFGALVSFVHHETNLEFRQNNINNKGPLHSFVEQFSSLLIGGVLVGLAFSIRYAGFFLFVTTLIFYGARFAVRRDKNSALSLLCVGSSSIFVILIFARNLLLAGTLTGGNEKIVHNPILTILRNSVASYHHLFFGETVPTRLGLFEVLLLLGGSILFLAALRGWQRNFRVGRRAASASHGVRNGMALLVIYVAVYSSGMIYLGATTVISFGPRMFYPLIPVLLIVGAVFLDKVSNTERYASMQRWAISVALSATIIGYLMINITALSVRPPSSPHLQVTALLQRASSNGHSPMEWIDKNVPADAVILAANGQATAYALGRRTVSLIESHYSGVQWDERTVHDVMKAFKADFLILYPGAEPSVSPAQAESSFLKGLLSGPTPSWLTVVAENGEARIFSVNPIAQDTQGATFSDHKRHSAE